MEPGSKLKLHMRGTLDDGRVFYDTHAQGGIPIEITIGESNFLPTLENAIREMEAGQHKTINLAAADAYGPYNPELTETLELSKIPNGDKLPLGEYVIFSSDQGPLRVKVAAIEDGMVTFDYNHELAGQDLTFDVNVVKVLDVSGGAVDHERYYAEEECGCKGILGHDHDHEHDCACSHSDTAPTS